MCSQPNPANNADNPDNKPEHLPCYCELELMTFSSDLHVVRMRLLVFGHLDYSIRGSWQNPVIPSNDVRGRKWARDALHNHVLSHAVLHSARMRLNLLREERLVFRHLPYEPRFNWSWRNLASSILGCSALIENCKTFPTLCQ